jgi:hypothetical protein
MRNAMPPYSYRVINLGHLGDGTFAVRRFADKTCEETVFVFKTNEDPELRSTEKKIIAHAESVGGWRKI